MADEASNTSGDHGDGGTSDDPITEVAPEFDGPSARRDQIAEAMWQDYLAVRQERGIDSGEESEGEADDELE